VKKLLVALWGFITLRKRRKRPRPEQQPPQPPPSEELPVLPPPDPRAEGAVIVLLLLAALCGAAFVFFYATSSIPHQTQWLGLSLGVALALVAAALIVLSKTVLDEEESEEDYPQPEHPDEQEQIGQLVERSGSRFTRKGLLKAAGGAAALGVGAALVAPAASLGPVTGTNSLYDTPWKRGRRLVDTRGKPMRADDIEQGTFYTAFPEGAGRDDMAAPLVLVRLDPAAIQLPAGRKGWAPQGILAYSKICTHAGCAVALYRKPTFPPIDPRPALVCPCHYSTFDPARGADVIFGPAGRPLPQLPLEIDPQGNLRAAGNFSGPVGPAWWGVHLRGPGNPSK
jgi:quinol---cytochrome c reductase iron-sulfur subunit